jgi:beta-lactamase regulating signal transducer with metallopeptidase domain
MPALFVFLLKVNVALLLFCAGYYLVLRHLTFYTLNRIYLVTAILFASIYPQINLSGFFQQHQQIAKPVQTVILNWQAPAEALVKPIAKPDYWYWIEVIFWAGVILLALRLIMQLYSLFKLYRSSTTAQLHNHEVRIMNGNSGPFSFWKSIYINPANHEPADLKSILLHEQIHVSEWHTIDVLLAELSTIFYWFNPGVWLMKKAIRENIEFITDRKILKSGVDTRPYQYSLVSVSFAASSPNAIFNHFNISAIKKRIIMMNANRSSKFTLSHYAVIMPLILICLIAFNSSKAELVKKSVKIIPVISKNSNSTLGSSPIVIANKLTDNGKNAKTTVTKKSKRDSVTFFIDGVITTKAVFQNGVKGNKLENLELIKDASNPGVGAKYYATTKKDQSAIKKDTTGYLKPKIKTHAEDSVVVNKQLGITQLFGKAEFSYKDSDIHADYIEYNEKTGKGNAKGNVIYIRKLKSGDMKSTASEFIFSLDSL